MGGVGLDGILSGGQVCPCSPCLSAGNRWCISVNGTPGAGGHKGPHTTPRHPRPYGTEAIAGYRASVGFRRTAGSEAIAGCRVYLSPRQDAARVTPTRYGVFIVLCLMLCLLSACGGINRPVTVRMTPTPATAAGEAVLPHSQIHFRDAPLPTQADLNFTSDDWTLAGHDSYSTRAVILPACCSAVTASPRPLWYHSLGVPLLDSPVISAGRLYLPATDGYLHVLDARTGGEQWRVALGGELAANGLALAHGIVYVARDGHYIAALDAASGRERWRFDTIGVVRAAPLVVGRVLLVSSGANSLWCLDALTGQQYWVFHSEDALMQFWPTRTPPVAAGGLVYVALGASSEFNALDLRTGRKVWEVALPERVTGGPLFDQALGLVYLITWSGRVAAFAARTGKVQWDIHLPAGSESSPALSPDNILYLGSFDDYLYALDAATGRMRWRSSMGSAVTASPLVVQGTTQTWVIAASQAGVCLVVDASSGKVLYTWRLGELRASPVVARGVLYQASLGDQGLFAFQL
jgi:outer membrane protein assembly factor BamB